MAATPHRLQSLKVMFLLSLHEANKLSILNQGQALLECRSTETFHARLILDARMHGKLAVDGLNLGFTILGVDVLVLGCCPDSIRI